MTAADQICNLIQSQETDNGSSSDSVPGIQQDNRYNTKFQVPGMTWFPRSATFGVDALPEGHCSSGTDG